MNKSNIIYHYCGVDAFMAILEGRAIRLGNMRKMNDYVEHNWLLSLARSRLEALQVKESTSNPFFPMVISELQKGPIVDSFCASFSSDGDILSQWRAYADDGCGFAIGFNTGYFTIEPREPEMTFFDKETLAEWNVVYDRARQDEYLNGWIENYLYYARKYAITDKEENANQSYRLLWTKSITCKNPKFSEEKETRIVYVPHPTEQSRLLKKGYRIRSKEITSFYILPFSEERKEPPVARIVLGPKNTARNDLAELLEFIDYCGLNHRQVEIVRSEATYR